LSGFKRLFGNRSNGEKSKPNRKKKMKRIIKALLTVFIVFIIFFNSLPFFLIASLHTGMIMVYFACTIILLVLYPPNALKKLSQGRLSVIFKIFKIGSIAVVILFIVISGFMISAIYSKPAENATAIVLGAKLHGDVPSLTLTRRLNAALEYLNENPEAYCVVAGGQGVGETVPEGVAMKKYLVDRGIEESRIFVEQLSVNTSENIRFSKEILEANGLDNNAAIITDKFHQYRAQSFARQEGIECGAACSETYFPLTMGYWVRETIAVIKMWLFNY